MKHRPASTSTEQHRNVCLKSRLPRFSANCRCHRARLIRLIGCVTVNEMGNVPTAIMRTQTGFDAYLYAVFILSNMLVKVNQMVGFNGDF